MCMRCFTYDIRCVCDRRSFRNLLGRIKCSLDELWHRWKCFFYLPPKNFVPHADCYSMFDSRICEHFCSRHVATLTDPCYVAWPFVMHLCKAMRCMTSAERTCFYLPSLVKCVLFSALALLQSELLDSF